MNYTTYCNQTKRLLLTEKKKKKNQNKNKQKQKQKTPQKKPKQNKQTNKKEKKTHQNYGIKWNNKFYKYGDSAKVCG